MNIVGAWSKQQIPGEHEVSWPSGTFDLDFSDNVTVIETESVKLIYEGTIFDRTSNELINSQIALDNAYGLYSYIKIEKKEQEIIIGTDKMGFSPVYYSLQDDSLFFSTSLTLLKYKLKKVSPDYEAWDDILNFGDIIGEKTTIKEIKRLDPGTRIHISNGKISFKVFWNYEIPDQADEDDYIKNNNELLGEALELTRSTPNTKVILLSGGEDSRRIAVSAHAIGLPSTFATQESGLGAGKDTDTLIAEAVSNYLQSQLIRVKHPTSEGILDDTSIRDYWLGYETFLHEWILPLLRKIPQNSLIYDGLAGDVTINAGIFRPFYLPGLLGLYKDKDIDKIAKTFCKMNNHFPFKKPKLESSSFDRIREQLHKYPESPHRVNYFYLMNHSRRNIVLMDQLISLMGHKICCPFLYYPLFMQSLSLDPKTQLKVLYHRECMRALNPEVVDIPSTKGEVGIEYTIDRAKEANMRMLLFSKNIKLRQDVKDIFPGLRSRIAAFKLASFFGISRITSRMTWRMRPLHRMSSFFDWLEDSEQPGFPIRAEEPQFLKV